MIRRERRARRPSTEHKAWLEETAKAPSLAAKGCWKVIRPTETSYCPPSSVTRRASGSLRGWRRPSGGCTRRNIASRPAQVLERELCRGQLQTDLGEFSFREPQKPLGHLRWSPTDSRGRSPVGSSLCVRNTHHSKEVSAKALLRAAGDGEGVDRCVAGSQTSLLVP